MTQKPFEELTISDDFMFCKVMEYEPICREFLEMLFSAKIEKITYLSSQNTVTANSGAKSVRLDVLQIRNAVVVQDHSGTTACRGFGGFHALACEALESLAAAAHGVELGQFAACLFKCPHLLGGAMDVARVFDCSKDAGQEVRRFVVLHNGSS